MNRLPLSLTPDDAIALARAVWPGEWFVQADNSDTSPTLWRHRYTLWTANDGNAASFQSLRFYAASDGLYVGWIDQPDEERTAALVKACAGFERLLKAIHRHRETSQQPDPVAA